jgi:glutaredoxin domain-containing cysteine-rich protein 1
VRVDERGLSMHMGFKGKLRAALGDDGGGRLPPLLPQVFADGRHLGGAEEVRRLHEAGELASALDACDAAPCTSKKSWVVACCLPSRAWLWNTMPMQNLGNPRQRGSGWV